MKITCHSCSAKYTVSDEKVQGKTVKMKCRKCGATIVVGGAGGAAAEASAAPVDDAAQGEAPLPVGSYLVNVADNDQRTMSTPEILDAIRQGTINGDTYVWTDGMADWQAIADHPELSQGLQGGGAPVPAAAPSPGYGASAYGGGFDGNGNGNAHAPLAAAASTDSSRPAARKDTARRGNDLFGGGGGGASLSSGGGFGGGGGLAAAAPTAGKRDENSVLFSLSALTQAAPVSTRNATSATKDDSGLIDLKALAATATPAPAVSAASPMLESPALFPLGAAPAPVAAPVAPIAPGYEAQPKKNAMLIPLAIAGVLAVGLIIAVFFLVQGSGPAPQPSVVYVEKPAPAPVETVAAAPTSEPTAAPTADASATATAVAATPKGGWKGGGRPTAPATAKTTGGTAPTPPATSKPSTAKKCGCAPGDLACAMKCSAK